MVTPILFEFPFFILMILLIDFITFYTIVRHPLDSYDIWEYWVVHPRLRFLFITIVYSYLLTLIIYYVKIKMLKVLCYLLVISLVVVDIFLYLSCHVFFSSNILLIIFETNVTEIKDFAHSYLLSKYTFITLIVFVLISCVCYLLEEQRKRIACYFFQLNQRRKVVLEIVLISFLGGGVVSAWEVVALFRCNSLADIDNWEDRTANSTDLLTNVLFCSWNLKLSSEVLPKAEQSTIDISKTKHQLSWVNNLTDVILVIGESYIKSHSNIYGYNLNTTPWMTKEKDAGRLFAYADVISPFIYTSESVRNILSTNSIGNKEQWYEFPFFPAIFKKVGFDVLFWDNQYDPLSIYSCDFTLNAYLHSPVITSLSYDKVRPYISMCDADLVSNYQQYFYEHQTINPTFTIFHLQGQHFSTEERYPQSSEFKHFTVDSIRRFEEWMTTDKKDVIAHYDNCTLYNDYVLNQIISIFRDKCSVIVYLSDHGEDVYDTGDVLGRRESSLQSYEIPLFIWCSDKYKEQHGDIVESIKKSVNKPLMSDNLCHLLFHLGGVKSTYYNDSRDVLSPCYKCPPRIIAGNQNYDLLKQQKEGN